MSDRPIYVPTHVSGPSHVTVTEQRAPTADSARFLREVEQAAIEKIVASHRLKTTEFDILVMEMQRQMVTEKRTLILSFVLNGGHRLQGNKPYILEVPVGLDFVFNRREAFKLAMEKLGQCITAALIERFAGEFMRTEKSDV